MRIKILLLVGLAGMLLAGGYQVYRNRSVVPKVPPMASMTPQIAPGSAAEADDRKAVSPAEMRFLVSEHQQAVLILDAAARRMPDPGWTQQPGERYEPVRWNPTTWEGVWKSPTRELAIRISNTTSWADGFELAARHRPPQGWGVDLQYARSFEEPDDRQVFHFNIFPALDVLPADETARVGILTLSPGDATLHIQFEDRRTEYRLLVHSRDLSPVTVTSNDIRAYLSSPESFRQAALTELTRLRDRGKEKTRSGEGFEISLYQGIPGVFRAGDVSEISGPIRQKAHDQVEAQVETQIQWVKTHSAAMHACLVDAFPEFRNLFAEAVAE